MKFNKVLRALCIGAVAATIGGAAALSGCTIETNHARAKITVEFNSETYELEYTLYRNMYPVTVRHFIELADAGFYDNTIIHNYTSTDWYGGGYAYDVMTDDAGTYADACSNASMTEYLSANNLEDTNFNGARDNYYDLFYTSSALTASVYTNYSGYDKNDNMTVDSSAAYHTVYGEFSNNGHTIENGEREAIKGSLKMYYTTKVIDDTAKAQVYVKTNKKEVLVRDYQYNSATSLFAIQVSDSSALSTSSYATFGSLRSDDDLDTLEDLLEAIDDYIDDNYNDDSDKFTVDAESVYTDNIEQIANAATEVDYTLTVEPIIIKSVKITKY
ncbi:MAG: peptidylprolyl isomerase [Clostridia bacterium]|nr:peptidylprolyl isomerase [Clostridia bacterium]